MDNIDNQLDEILEQAQQAYQLCHQDKLDEAKVLILSMEAKQDNFDDEYDKAVCRCYAAACLVVHQEGS